MADKENKFAPEPEHRFGMVSRVGDVHATAHAGAIKGTRDLEVFQQAMNHTQGSRGLRRPSGISTASNNNLV